MGVALSTDADVGRLTKRLGARWATAETSFKWHASCRHTHPSADALLALIKREGIDHGDIQSIEVHVHQAAIDVLGRVDVPQTVHQAKFSMGTMLGLVAVHRRAGLDEFEQSALTDPRVANIRDATIMRLDPAVDRAYPDRWLGRVTVVTKDGRTLYAAIDEPKGDPGNTLSRSELEGKFRNLAARAGTWSDAEVDILLETARNLRGIPKLGTLLALKNSGRDSAVLPHAESLSVVHTS